MRGRPCTRRRKSRTNSCGVPRGSRKRSRPSPPRTPRRDRDRGPEVFPIRLSGPLRYRRLRMGPMPTAFDLIWRNAALQEHWIRRFFAFLIDLVIIVAVGLFIAIPIGFLFWFWTWVSPLYFGVIWFLYSALLETAFGGTVGKKVVALRVVAIGQNLD